MNKEKIKIAIIGCGRIAGHHCRAISESNEFELVAVCDLVAGKAEEYAKQFGTLVYENYHQMLKENPQINTVAVITPSGMHYEHVIDILKRYKKNIIVEKPTFLKPSQVTSAYALAAEVGCQIFAIFQNRHNLAVQRVATALKSNELGKIRSVAVRVRWCRPQRYYDLAPWRGTFSMDGGCLTNQGIHHIDLLRHLGGEIKRVCSVTKTMGADIEVEDTATAVFEFENGAIGSLEVTTAARPIDYEASLSFVCEEGLAQIGGIAVNELQIFTPDPAACEMLSEDFSGNVYGNGHAKIYKEIGLSLLGDDNFPVDVKDVSATIRLLNAFYISDEKQSWVDVNISGDSARLGKTDESLANLYRANEISI